MSASIPSVENGLVDVLKALDRSAPMVDTAAVHVNQGDAHTGSLDVAMDLGYDPDPDRQNSLLDQCRNRGGSRMSASIPVGLTGFSCKLTTSSPRTVPQSK